MGWSGKENGELLALAADSGFDAMLTKDAGVQYEQNLSNLPLSVIILKAATNDLEDVLPLVPALLGLLKNLSPNQVSWIP